MDNNVIFCATLAGAFSQAGFAYPTNAETDSITRFSTNGKTHDTSGWLRTFPDGRGAVFGCWREGTSFVWQQRIDGAPAPTSGELKQAKAQAAQARKQAEAERAALHAQVAKLQAVVHAGLPDATAENAYCKRKGITPPDGAKQGQQGQLVIPVYDGDGRVQSTQQIFPDSRKQFATDAKMKGGRFVFGALVDGEPMTLCEGFSTSASVFASGISAVVNCFSGSNLAVIAADLRKRYPNSFIRVAGDLDAHGKGAEYARAAVAAAMPNSEMVLPVFSDGRDRGDFNDLHQFAGLDAVRSQLEKCGRAGSDSSLSNGAQLLKSVHAFIGRFVSYPSPHSQVAHTLWIAHTHLMNAWESTPRIAFLSPEPGSGKTRALEISETLVPRPIEAINATPAYIFRKVSDPDGAPTILFDEIDTLFGAKAKEHEEIRGILNAGHRRGAMAGRCVVRGKIIETEELPAYCAVALAGLGNLPDTILTRSVIVRMRRRAPNETVEPYRRRIHSPEGYRIRDQLAAWALQLDLSDTWPQMPEGIEDRNADVWEALLAVADAAGGDWPEKARVAAVAHVADSRVGTPSLGIRLLHDLRVVFADHTAMTTKAILDALHNLDEAPWADLKGKPLDARRLATYLKAYGVNSKGIRVGDSTPKGYSKEDFFDPWARYLSNKDDLGVAANGAATSATSETNVSETPCEAEAGHV